MSIKKKIGVVIIYAGMFLLLGALVHVNGTDAFDREIQAIIFSCREEFLTQILIGITYLGNWQTIVVICTFALLYKKTRVEIGVSLSVAGAISTMVYKLVKVSYNRPRPDGSLHLIEQGGLSFPSGHAMTGLVFYGLIIYFLVTKTKKSRAQKALLIGLASLIFLIGISRIYLGVHYPTDVLAGWCLGASLLTTIIIVKQHQGPDQRKYFWNWLIRGFHSKF